MSNTVFQIILIVVASLGSVGVLAGGIGYFVKAFRKGTKEEKSEVINTSQEVINFWKSQAENLQVIMERKEKDWNDKFQGMSKEIGELRGQLNAEKAQNDRLEKIFQNRDPESQEFMKLVMNAIQNQQVANNEFLRVLGDIHSIVTDEHNREMKVEATVTKV